jgi:hypothetical protein
MRLRESVDKISEAEVLEAEVLCEHDRWAQCRQTQDATKDR